MILKNTYLLTTSGWETIQNLSPNQSILGINNNRLISSTITNIKNHQFSGKVYTTRNSQIPPDTRLLTKTKRLKKIKNIKNYNDIISPTYVYSGNKFNPITHEDSIYDTCLIFNLIGYFVECGKIKDNEIIFKNSENKLNKISKLLTQLNVESFIVITQHGWRLITKNKSLHSFLSQCYSTEGTFIPQIFLNFDVYYLRYLLAGIMDASSKLNITQKLEKIIPIISSSKRLVDNLHELIIKLGFLFNTSAIYRDPMRRVQYDPLNTYGTPSFEIRLMSSSFGKITTKILKSSITSYTLSLAADLKFILIRNGSKPLWVNVS